MESFQDRMCKPLVRSDQVSAAQLSASFHKEGDKQMNNQETCIIYLS